MKETTLQCYRVRAFFCLKQRYAILLLLLSILNLSHTRANANTLQDSLVLTMTLSNAPLEKAFTIIKQQTPYRVIYDNSLLKKAKPVTLAVNKEPLPRVLALLFHNQPFNYRIIEQAIILTPQSQKRAAIQNETSLFPASEKDTLITGVVMADSSLVQLSGATVQLRGTNVSVTTDNNGKFSISIPESGGTLIVTYVGYSTSSVRVSKNTQAPLNVFMTAIPKEMDEVTIVSTGYESLPKERATGSFATVSEKRFNEQVSTNILDRLPAVANGLSLDRRTSSDGLMIRGISSIQGPTEPLIILDNFPFEGDIQGINPNDIESITILKDAAAASIWGTKAGNGVIVITTKKGRLKQPLSIAFNANTTIIEKPDLFYAKQMSSTDFIEVEKFLFDKQYRFSDTSSMGRPAFSPVYEILFKNRNGLISDAEANAQLQGLAQHDIRDEFSKYMYQAAVNQQYAINIQGGSDKSSWITSLGYDKNRSNTGEKYERISFRIENMFRPVSRLSITAGGYYTYNAFRSGKSGYGSISTSRALPPYTRFADESGNALPVFALRENYLDTAGGGKLLDWRLFPLDDYKYTTNNNSVQNLLAKLGVNYLISKNLFIDILYQYERQESDLKTLYDVNGYYARDLINRFSQLNYSTGQVTYKVPVGSVLDLSNELLQSHNFRAQFNYDNSWGRHSITTIGGTHVRQSKIDRNAYRSYGYDRDVLTSGFVDFTTPYPDFVTGSLSFIPNIGGNPFFQTINRFVSFYGNLAYSYDRRYTITLSGRRDGSNLFGAKTNDKWKPLWSTGVSWDIHQEQFYKSSLIPYLRLRATYGYSGNVDQAKTAFTIFQYLNNSPYTTSPIGRILSFANPELRWEQVRMINAGLDFRMKNNRLSGSIETYFKKGQDLFGTDLLDYTGGAGSSIIKNVASMKGHGLDIELNSINILSKSINWKTDLNLSINKDKVVDYYLPNKQGSNFVARNIPAGLEGRPVFSIFSYKWAGLDPLTGDPLGYVNGIPSNNYVELTGSQTQVTDLFYHGPALPILFGSLGNNISIRKLSLAFRLTYKFGHYFRRESIRYFNLFGGANGHSDYSKRWQNPGDELSTFIPSMSYPAVSSRDNFFTGSEVLVSKADHIRFQYLTLNYDIEPNWIKGFKNAQLYFSINNIGIIWRANKEGIDPDYPNATIPPAKSYSIGIRAGF